MLAPSELKNVRNISTFAVKLSFHLMYSRKYFLFVITHTHRNVYTLTYKKLHTHINTFNTLNVQYSLNLHNIILITPAILLSHFYE